MALVGFTGWFREVLPREHREKITGRETAEEDYASPLPVAHLRIGEEDHRARLPLEIYPYSAGIKGGIAGGFVMAAMRNVHGIVLHGSPWYTINLLAASGMASLATASAATLAAFNLQAFMVALMIHAVVSLLVGLLYGVLLPMLPRYPIVLAGIVAPLLWSGLLWSSLNVIDPLLNRESNGDGSSCARSASGLPPESWWRGRRKFVRCSIFHSRCAAGSRRRFRIQRGASEA